MENKYAFIVAYTDNYIKGITALENSVQKYCPHIELVKHYGDSIENTAIKRFYIACELSHWYDAICLMDADMFLTADPTLFFDIACKGFIVTGSNGMVIDFNKSYQEQYQLDLGREHCVYPKIHTTAPIFLNKDNIDWFEKFLEKRERDHWDDFLYLNMVGIKMEKDKKTLCMPPYAFTGIHHFNLKPVTGLIKIGDQILSGTEEQIYMIHGKFFDKEWYLDLMKVMKRYFKDEEFGERQLQQALRSRKIMMDEFIALLEEPESLSWLQELESED